MMISTRDIERHFSQISRDWLAMILEKQPELAGVFAEALDELEAGHLTTADLADIMGYAAYRINLGKHRKAG